MQVWIALFSGIGVTALWYGRRQPFPRYARGFATACLLTAGLLLVAASGPRPTEPRVPMVLALGIGMVSTLIGSRLMGQSKRDVVVAPLASILFATGAITLFAGDWTEQSVIQQLAAFVLTSLLVMLSIYLCFRGLVIGVPGIAWSQAGLLQLQRGLIGGPNGAIACFERAWDEEDHFLDAMSQAALCRIHAAAGNEAALESHLVRLRRHGGWSAIEVDWIAAIDSALRSNRMTPAASPMTGEE